MWWRFISSDSAHVSSDVLSSSPSSWSSFAASVYLLHIFFVTCHSFWFPVLSCSLLFWLTWFSFFWEKQYFYSNSHWIKYCLWPPPPPLTRPPCFFSALSSSDGSVFKGKYTPYWSTTFVTLLPSSYPCPELPADAHLHLFQPACLLCSSCPPCLQDPPLPLSPPPLPLSLTHPPTLLLRPTPTSFSFLLFKLSLSLFLGTDSRLRSLPEISWRRIKYDLSLTVKRISDHCVHCVWEYSPPSVSSSSPLYSSVTVLNPQVGAFAVEIVSCCCYS